MRYFSYSLLLACVVLGLAGCSPEAPNRAEDVHVMPAGEKAIAGHLTYSVLDSQILTQAGSSDTPRVPKDRFIVVQLAVTNTGNTDASIPGVTLEGDTGTSYNELTDGSGIANFLGVLRRVAAGQTTRGAIAFDAPAAHYRLRFADEESANEIMADLPLTFAHEKVNGTVIPGADMQDLSDTSGTTPAAPPAAK